MLRLDDIVYDTCVQNLMTVALAVSDMGLVPTKIEMVHVT